MSDALNEAYDIVQCKQCPWYKACAMPMRFTAEDIRRQMEQAGQAGMNQADMNMQMLSNMATAAQNSMLEGCPVFIDRLRKSPKLAQKIKELMQNWSKEES
jgi:hypothetical protein